MGELAMGEKPKAGSPSWRTNLESVAAGKICPREQVRVRSHPSALPRHEARIAFHPGDLKLAETGGLAATIRRVTYRGDILRVELSIGPDDQTLFMNVPAPARIEAGQRVAVTLADGWVLPDLQTEHA